MAQVPTAVLGVLIISLAVLLAVAAAILVQRLVPLETRKSHTTPLGLVNAGLNVTFGVIVGFSAFLVLNKHQAAQQTVEGEAGDVEEIYALAQQFPEPEQDKVQGLATSYTRELIKGEWPSMNQGRMSPRADALADELRMSIQNFEPETNNERALYSYALGLTGNLSQARDLREAEMDRGLPTLLWIALGSLAVSIVFFASLAGMENRVLHLVVISVLAQGLALVLFTLVMIDHPFGTGLRVGPEPFESALHKIEGNGGQ